VLSDLVLSDLVLSDLVLSDLVIGSSDWTCISTITLVGSSSVQSSKCLECLGNFRYEDCASFIERKLSQRCIYSELT
jgi:hypothetical protein